MLTLMIIMIKLSPDKQAVYYPAERKSLGVQNRQQTMQAVKSPPRIKKLRFIATMSKIYHLKTLMRHISTMIHRRHHRYQLIFLLAQDPFLTKTGITKWSL